MLDIDWANLTPRERDALVAEKVMGALPEVDLDFLIDWSGEKRPQEGWRIGDVWHLYVPKYTSRIEDAWQVVEKMADCLHLCEHDFSGQWKVNFCGFPGSSASAKSAPEAICLAALKACGVNFIT